jgi:hypothetical protein
MFYVYEHIRPDTGKIFYVGKGSGKRAFTRRGRNRYWHRVVNKTGSFSVRLVAENLDEELAFLVEGELIDKLKRINVPLCNSTLGGEGVSGYVFTEESKQKMSLRRKGVPKGPMPDATKQKISQVKTEEFRKKISNALKGRKRSPQECANISQGQKGKTLSVEHRKKLSIARSGEKNHMWGRTHNDVAMEKIRQSRFNCKKVECPHCKKVADTANAARWHFNKCKMKGNNDE